MALIYLFIVIVSICLLELLICHTKQSRAFTKAAMMFARNLAYDIRLRRNPAPLSSKTEDVLLDDLIHHLFRRDYIKARLTLRAMNNLSKRQRAEWEAVLDMRDDDRIEGIIDNLKEFKESFF